MHLLTPRPALPLALSVFALLVAPSLLGGGCFDPEITSGNLQCAPAGKPCPDGFVCQGAVCVRPGGGGGSGGVGGGGTGGAGGMCAGTVQPLCQPPAGVPGPCDVVCQTGCGCGQRCTVADTSAACATGGGVRTVGQVCNPNRDDCAPGDICLLESCGANLGRCYRFCRADNGCMNGICNTPVLDSSGRNTGYEVCDLANQPCDPYAQTGCPDPSLRCFALGASRTICDCPGDPARERNAGESCSGYSECAPGLACLEVGGSARCFRLCRGVTDCLTCTPLGGISYCAI